MANREIVNTQFRASTNPGNVVGYGAYIDCSHLLAGDFLVIVYVSGVGGGGNNYYNRFVGGSENAKLSGFFGTSGDIFGHVDGTLASGSISATMFRHTVLAADLTDGGGGAALDRIGAKRDPNSDYLATAMGMWTIRNVTYSSHSSSGTNANEVNTAGPFTLTRTGSTLTKYQAAFMFGCIQNQGDASGTGHVKGVSDDKTGFKFTPVAQTQLNWQNVKLGFISNFAMNANSTVGRLADTGTVTWTYTTDSDASTTYQEAILSVVTFAEDMTPPVDRWNWSN